MSIISVIVSTLSLHLPFQYCLKSLISQDCNKTQYTIIIINDGQDDIEEYLKKNKYFEYGNIELINSQTPENTGLSVARNKGLLVNKNPYVIFTDGDIIYSRNFVSSHLKYLLSNKKTVIIGSRYELVRKKFNINSIQQIEKIQQDINNKRIEFVLSDYHTKVAQKALLDNKKIAPWLGFVTANVSLPVSILEKTGSFDENIKYGCVEDIELGYRIFKKGYRFLYKSQLKCYHIPHPLTWHRYLFELKNLKYMLNKHPELKNSKLVELQTDKITYEEFVLKI